MFRRLLVLGLGLSLCLATLAATAAGLLRPAIDFPLPAESYGDQQIPSLFGKLTGRIQREPLNLVGTIIFSLRSFTRFWPVSFVRLFITRVCPKNAFFENREIFLGRNCSYFADHKI